jgi:type I restriction enzyme R subunit
MTMTYSERNLEEHIERGLLDSGFNATAPTEYDAASCIIPADFIEFIKLTQKPTYDRLAEQYGTDTDKKLIARLSSEVASRGIIDVARKGFKDRGCHFLTVFFEPKSGLNPEHQELYQKNRFSCVRQVRYSLQNGNSLDMVLFLNGLPIVTMELKNQLTGQTILDGEKQYRADRDPNEPLFKFKRVLVHFCCDNDRVSMTTRLMGAKTRFLPYNKGIENPINPRGMRTSYLWEEILTPASLLDILENFAHVATETDRDYDPNSGAVVELKKELLVFPRYHQLDVIRKLRTEIKREGVGYNYLIQHTAGSGKSYSIGWLSHLLTSLYQTREDSSRIFDTIIVITDRKVLDKQLQNTIKQLEQTNGVVNPIDLNSTQLKEYLERGKDIIITTIQKFPHISKSISQLQSKTFGIIIDEVHSSQSGEGSKHLKKSLSRGVEEDFQEDEEIDDIDDFIREEIRSRGRQKHISFFGFSGTPKSKTLELFGRKDEQGNFVPFHSYTMKQSIAEGFTLDVLENYITYKQWFKLNKKVEEDRELPKMKVMKQLINFVDDKDFTITNKVKTILHHFINNTSRKLEGRSRGMVVVRSRLHCVRYKLEFDKQMRELGLSYGCLVAFSGTVTDEDTHTDYTENSLNQLPQGVSIPDAFKEPKYRLLIVSNKFQTGYDEPLLHSMYVDKTLRGLQCVQTLSRLNRTRSGKTDTFVMDFVNTTEEILESFQPYYQKTMLVGETDPNRLYTLETDIKNYNLFTVSELDSFSEIFFDKSKEQELLQPILNRVVQNWGRLEVQEERENFRSLIQSYIRLYGYISQIATFSDIDLEKLYVFLKYLNKKLPKRERQNIEDITSLVDLDSFRMEETFRGKISLEDNDGEFEALSVGSSRTFVEDEREALSLIIQKINDIHGSPLSEEDRIDFENLTRRVTTNEGLLDVMNSDNSESNKRHKLDEVLSQALLSFVNDKLHFYNKLEKSEIRNMFSDFVFNELQNMANRRPQG